MPWRMRNGCMNKDWAQQSINDQHRALVSKIAQLSGNQTGTMPVADATKLATKYITMGIHFEKLMDHIKSSPTLLYEWDNLMLLLKMSAEDD